MTDADGRKRLFWRGSRAGQILHIKIPDDVRDLQERVVRGGPPGEHLERFLERVSHVVLQPGDSLELTDEELRILNLRSYQTLGTLSEVQGPPVRASQNIAPDRGPSARRRPR